MAVLSALNGGEHFYLYYASDILGGGSNIIPAAQISKDALDQPINAVGIGTTTISKSAAPPTYTITTNEFSEEFRALLNSYITETEVATDVAEYSIQSGGNIRGAANTLLPADFFVLGKINDTGQFQNRAGQLRNYFEFGFGKINVSSSDISLAQNAWTETTLALELVMPPSAFEGIALSALGALPGYPAPSTWIDGSAIDYYVKNATTGKVSIDNSTPTQLVFKNPGAKWLQDAFCPIPTTD